MDVNKGIKSIRKSRKYKNITLNSAKQIVKEEIKKQKNKKIVIIKTKERPHKVWTQFPIGPFMEELDLLFSQENSTAEPDIFALLTKILSCHMSTNGRINEMKNIYNAIFTRTVNSLSIADIACCLNPFSFRWMQLPQTLRYEIKSSQKGWNIKMLNFATEIILLIKKGL